MVIVHICWWTQIFFSHIPRFMCWIWAVVILLTMSHPQQKYSAKLIGQNFENCSSSTNQVSLDWGTHDTAAAALLQTHKWAYVSSHGKRFFRKCVEHTKLLRCPISLECFDQAQRLFTFEFVEVISNVEIKSSEHGLDKPNLTPMIHNCLSLVYASFPRMLSSCLGVVYFIAEAFASGLSSFQSISRKIFYYFVSTYLISTWL